MTKFKTIATALAFATVLSFGSLAHADDPPVSAQQVYHRTVKIDGLDIFYREAGSKDAPTVLLLHGFPTSSHMFRNLIPALADKYHVVAPDYPGYGYSSMPAVDEFEYTFDNLADVVEKFTEKVGLKKYSIYLMDYGAQGEWRRPSHSADVRCNEVAVHPWRPQRRNDQPRYLEPRSTFVGPPRQSGDSTGSVLQLWQ